MQSGFNPYDPADMRRQADLYRRLAALMRKPEVKARFTALAAQYEETAAEAAKPEPPARARRVKRR